MMADGTKKKPVTGSLAEISCPSGPRRRAGFEFARPPVLIDLSGLTPEEIEAIQGDAFLVVRPAARPQTNQPEA